MANFERLIRGALASQNASSTEVRQVIYQSSRNALQKIIDNNRSLTLESVMEQKRKLEASIEKIEAEYNPQAPVSSHVEELQSEALARPIVIDEKPEEFITPSVAAAPKAAENDPLHEIQQILEITTPQATQEKPVSSVETEQMLQPEQAENAAVIDGGADYEGSLQQQNYYETQESIPLGFSKRRKTQKRFFWTLLTLLVLGLLAWATYIAVMSVLDGSLIGQNNDNGLKQNPNAISRQADSENYITVIEAGDLSSLVMSGRGKAQIVKQLNSDMIRVNSVRDALNRAEPALPILIKLKPGVLKQISGKRVTVEIFAKAGGGETAHFAVGCEFGNLTECGRKRFLAGSQPNASVFAFQMDNVNNINQDMFLTLSTDTTSQAAVTGKGDILDIVYIRLSIDN